jgi:alpha-methylacyl-CoA racemase
VRVLDLSTVGPAARASRILSDYGADVVKVGAVPRSGVVQITPPHYAYSGQRGMRRMSFDLKSEAGCSAFLHLADAADVVIESFRPGVAARLGVGAGDLLSRNPRLVYCSTSGFGQDGPRRSWAGHDLNYLAVGGFLDCSGRTADGRPALPGATVADIAAGGMQAAMSIMAALLERNRTGTGQHLDVSIADGVFAMMSLYLDEYLATGVEPGPGHYILTGRYACYDTYTCGDGRHLAVAAIEPQFWANLCRSLGLERWIDHQLDDSVQDDVRSDVAAVIATRSRNEWVGVLGPGDCCVAPVNTVAEATVDEQFLARRVVLDAEHPVAGSFRQVAAVWAGTVEPDEPVVVPDAAISDAVELLTEAGVDPDRVRQLIEDGVVA